MSVEKKPVHAFTRQPLATLGKLTALALFGSTIMFLGMVILIGEPIPALLIIAACLLVISGIVTTGVRWAPLLGSLVSGILLIVVSVQPYAIYHLTHPAEVGFFAVMVINLALLVMALIAGIGASVQNYRNVERRAPRWLTPTLTALAGIVVGALLVASVVAGTAQASPSATNTSGEATVHMGPGSFLQSSVTVSKGTKLLLVDDGSFPHSIANGAWQNGTPHPSTEPGAPTVNNIMINGNSIEVGPFSTAGTYHLYCSVHQGMNLTVIVQ